MAPPGPEEQDSLLLQRKSARRCVKQRPSYDIFEDSDDSEPGGPPAPRRRTPRENGMDYFMFSLSSSQLYVFFFCHVGDGTKGLVNGRQVLHLWATCPALVLCLVWKCLAPGLLSVFLRG